ncbi:MAG: hypothetical protein HRT53_20770 [Colwellia sp.]|nr:hypothetical protein [Colwellia sp.]
MKYRAGYLFKISHTEIHYLKNKKIDRRKKYGNNFSRDKSEAYIFNDKADFEAQITRFLDAANSEDGNHDYHFVLAFEEIKENKFELKEQGEHPCKYCGSYKYTQTLGDVGVICKECLCKSIDSALNHTLERLGVDHRV